MNGFMLEADLLPDGFSYPKQYLRFLKTGASELLPWYFLGAENLKKKYQGLRNRFNKRALVPFAVRDDNDDVACWEAGHGERVFIVHDFAGPGWEQREEFPDFNAWLYSALEEYIRFDP